MLNQLDSLTQQMIKRYSDRYHQMGHNVKTLGWGSKEQQDYRFSQALISDIQFTNKEVVDIGCGFGDFYTFLKIHQVRIKKYLGFDLNPDLIREAEKIHSSSANVRFEVKNIFEVNNNAPVADIGLMSGLLNLNWKEKFDNIEYSKKAVYNAFQMVKEVLIVDFISSYRTAEYPEEDFIYYHDPKVMLNYALSLSPNVFLKHNYSPIPQKEFMLFIFK